MLRLTPLDLLTANTEQIERAIGNGLEHAKAVGDEFNTGIERDQIDPSRSRRDDERILHELGHAPLDPLGRIGLAILPARDHGLGDTEVSSESRLLQPFRHPEIADDRRPIHLTRRH